MAIDITPDQLQAIQKGRAYQDLLQCDGYRMLLDYLEARSDLALVAMREAKLMDDRMKANLQMIWCEREEMLAAMQIEVQRGIESGKAVAQDLEFENGDFGLMMNFNGEGD